MQIMFFKSFICEDVLYWYGKQMVKDMIRQRDTNSCIGLLIFSITLFSYHFDILLVLVSKPEDLSCGQKGPAASHLRAEWL